MAREPEAIAELRRALGERLATCRKAAELTQGQLAAFTELEAARQQLESPEVTIATR